MGGIHNSHRKRFGGYVVAIQVGQDGGYKNETSWNTAELCTKSPLGVVSVTL